MGFQGSVESFSLADVFQNLAMNQQTGTLCIFVPGGPSRHIFFETGQVKFLSHGQQKPLLLGEVLIGRSIATEEQVQQALERQEETKEPFGKCMVALGHLDDDRLDALVKRQIEEEIYDLFGWEKAQFEFTDGPPPKDLFGEKLAGRGSTIPISHLIMEAARRVDEWDQLKQQIPSFKEIYLLNDSVGEAVKSGQLEVSAVEKRVLMLADGTRDVDDLIQDSFLFRFEVLKALASLTRASMIRPANAQELASGCEELKAAGDRFRFCKVLERRLAVGDDNPVVRRELAELLAEESQNEKAAIHFSVLAEAELQAGREDEGVALLKRILQIMPHHLNSRGRLGAIYAKRGQQREALVQYLELINTYRGNDQLAEARATCQRALECDQNHLGVRQQLIDIYIAEGEKEHAARNYEFMGDQLAKSGQARSGAEAYRKAMQLSPSMGHLKKKLANILLTQEDRRAQTKKALVITAVVVVVGLLTAGIGFHEWKAYATYQRAKERAQVYESKGDSKMAAEEFKGAAGEYTQALAVYDETSLKDAWTPITDAQGLTTNAINSLDAKIKDAWDKDNDKAARCVRDAKRKFEEAKVFNDKSDFYSARDKIKEVWALGCAPAKLDKEAQGLMEKVETSISTFESSLARIRKDPDVAFKSAEEEWRFKSAFLAKFSALPQLKNEFVKLPVQVFLNLNGVKVTRDKQLLGKANRDGKNIYRYDNKMSHMFVFDKPGYKRVERSTNNLPWSYTLKMVREPVEISDLAHALSGSALIDENWLYVGTAAGGLLRMDLKSFKLDNWAFTFPGGGNLGKEVSGQIVKAKGSKKQTLLLYGTKAGDLVAVDRDTKKKVWLEPAKGNKRVEEPPVLMTFSYNKSQFMVISRGHEVEAFDAAEGLRLGRGEDAFRPRVPVTTAPAITKDGKYIIFGSEKGKVYSVDASNGKKKLEWTTVPARKSAAVRGRPVVTEKHIYVSSADGKLYILEKDSGITIGSIEIQGVMSAPPVVAKMGEDTFLFVGTSHKEGFHGINLNRQIAAFSFTGERIVGEVTVAPAIRGNRVFFGTNKGMFYALENINGTFQLVWSYRATAGYNGLVSTPMVVGNKVMFITKSGKVYIFEE